MSRMNGYEEVTNPMMREKLGEAEVAMMSGDYDRFEATLKAMLDAYPDFRATMMRDALGRFIKAGYVLSDAWYAPASNNYPLYMPDFSDFLSEFGELMGEPDPDMANPILSVVLPLETELPVLEAIQAEVADVLEKHGLDIYARAVLHTDAQRVRE